MALTNLRIQGKGEGILRSQAWVEEQGIPGVGRILRRPGEYRTRRGWERDRRRSLRQAPSCIQSFYRWILCAAEHILCLNIISQSYKETIIMYNNVYIVQYLEMFDVLDTLFMIGKSSYHHTIDYAWSYIMRGYNMLI